MLERRSKEVSNQKIRIVDLLYLESLTNRLSFQQIQFADKSFSNGFRLKQIISVADKRRVALTFSVFRFWPFLARFLGFCVCCGLRLFLLFFPAFCFLFQAKTRGFSDLVSDVVFDFSYLASGFSLAIMRLNRVLVPRLCC